MDWDYFLNRYRNKTQSASTPSFHEIFFPSLTVLGWYEIGISEIL